MQKAEGGNLAPPEVVGIYIYAFIHTDISLFGAPNAPAWNRQANSEAPAAASGSGPAAPAPPPDLAAGAT